MTPATIIREAQADGVKLALSPTGTIKATGDGAAVNRWLPTIRERKAELLAALAGRTTAPLLPPPWDAIRDRIAQGWRAEFSAPGPDGRQTITWHPPGTWEPEPTTPRPETQLRRNVHHLTDGQLAGLVAETAKTNGVDPMDVWRWLSADDIEALRSGDPAETQAFRAAVDSACAGGRLMPDGGHSLPFPVQAGMKTQAIENKGKIIDSSGRDAKRFACGQCRNFKPDGTGDGSGIGACRVLADPPGGLLYPKIERHCRRFEGGKP